MTVMDLWCRFRGIQGGTIHQAKHEFRYGLTDQERDRFAGILVDNIKDIQDLHHVQDFMKLRLQACGLVIQNIA